MQCGNPLSMRIVLSLVLLLMIPSSSDAWGRRRRRRRAPPPPPPPDTTAPTFTYCPGNIGNQYTTTTTRSVPWSTPTATDNRGSATVSLTSGSGPGSTFAEGSHSSTYTARDGAGNTATCGVSFVVVVIRCGGISPPSRGSVSCTNSLHVGSRCTYSCTTGYRLTGGSTSRTCTQAGNAASWSGSASNCARITCSSLSNPSHGSVSCTDAGYYNSRCTFSCTGGYTMQGASTLTCSASGSWSGSAPSCRDTTAPVFTRCPSSQTIYASNLATSATASWSAPTVTDNSGQSITPQRARGAASGSSFVEGVHPITYTAQDSSGNVATTCSLSITCVVIRCSTLSASHPLQVTCPNGNIRGARCAYSCSTGYGMQGQSSTECRKSGTSGLWSNGPPTCQLLQCPAHPAIAHGSLVGSCSRNYGTTCRFACDSGYEINNSQRRCTVSSGSTNAFWEGADPVCTRIQCIKPHLTPHLQVSTTSSCPPGNQVPSGNQCLFSCSAGYYLTGLTALTCQHDRTWNHATPNCHLITCASSDLPAPANGEKRACPDARQNYGTVCTLACDVGYTPSTAVQRTCSDDGNGDGFWDGNDLTCTIVTCTALPAPTNGRITGCTYQGSSEGIVGRQKFSTACTLECHTGFSKTEGSNRRVCQASGQWDGLRAVCADNTPPVFTCPLDKELVSGALSTSAQVDWTEWEPLMGTDRGNPLPATLLSIDGSQVTFKPGMLPEGIHRLVYQGTDLSGNTASCSFTIQVQVTRCPPLPVPDRGLAILEHGGGNCQDGALFGETCHVTCQDGYRLSSDVDTNSRRCERSSDTNIVGYWTGRHEACDVKNCTVPAIRNGFVADCFTPEVAYQTTCQYRCLPGYTSPSGVESMSRTCQANQTWSGGDLHCPVTKTCAANFAIVYGSVTPRQCSSSDTVTFGTTCEFSCGEGYQLVGPVALACSTEGEWNHNEVPYCKDVQPPTFNISCPHQVHVDAEHGTLYAHVKYEEPIPADNSGQVNITSIDQTHNPGSVYPEGATTIRYLATDSSGLATICDVVVNVEVHRCPAQHPPVHGAVDGCPDPSYGSRCSFSCDVGFDLIGEASVSCDLSRVGNYTWSEQAPVCQIQTCPPLVIRPPATLSGCGHNVTIPYGSICTFHCPPGYRGLGHSNKRCEPDRAWSSTDFNCQRKACSPLVETAQIAITPSSCLLDPRYKDTCHLQCRTPGFEINPSSLVDTSCSANQTWTNDVQDAQCVDVQPPIFEVCPSNIVAYTERGSNQTNVQWDVQASDNSDNDPTVTCDHVPGVMTSKSYSVTCIARDETGHLATCKFNIDVIVRRCSHTFQPPLFGTVVGSCDTSHGSVCQVTCLVGYSLVGSSQASCEFDGTDMYWQTDEQPTCEVIGCSPLSIHDSVTISPASCTTSDKVHAGTVCTLHCAREGKLSGDMTSVTCLRSERWSEAEQHISSLACIDHKAPVITSCPSQPIYVTRSDFWGVEVSFNFPTAIDNWDNHLAVVTKPPNLATPYNFTSDTNCEVIFTDNSNNSAVCAFQVLVNNEVRPIVQYCPPGQNITTTTKMTHVGWDVPVFLPAPGTDIIETCNYGNTPTELPWGHHVIVYQAMEKMNGLKSECRIEIDITPVPCISLHSPSHGALACDDGFAYGRYCTVLCNDQYDVPRLSSRHAPQEIFICGTSGVWYPHANVPDCSRRRNPRRMNLPLSIMYFGGKCAPNDDQTLQRISQSFVDILSQTDFAEVCTKNKQCTTEHVDVGCGSANSRKKRALDLMGHSEGILPNDNDVTTVSVVLSVAPDQKASESIDYSQGLHETLVELAHHVHHLATEALSKSGGSGGIAKQDIGDSAIPSSKQLYDDIIIECHDGYIPHQKQPTCVACPLGHYFDKSSAECLECERGFYQDEQAQSQCKTCVNGTSTKSKGAKGASDCEVGCSPGHYSESGFAPCLSCDEGRFQPMKGQSSCFECPRGLLTIGAAIFPEDCKEPCSSGHYSPTGLYPCHACPAGTYQPRRQQMSCRTCGNNSTSKRGATSHEDCSVTKKE